MNVFREFNKYRKKITSYEGICQKYKGQESINTIKDAKLDGNRFTSKQLHPLATCALFDS